MIYFTLELREGGTCAAGCEVDRGQLLIIPHPQSRREVRRFRLPVPGGNRREGNRGDHVRIVGGENGGPATRHITRKMTVTISASW